MAKFGFPVPIVPGKEDLAGRIYDEMRARMGEYEESRRNAGLTLERTYFQRNPDGSTLLVVYAEGSGSMGDVARAFATSGIPFDQWFMDVNRDLSGIDFRQPAPGGGPEHIASWEAPSGARGKGIALCAPLLPGKTEAGKSWLSALAHKFGNVFSLALQAARSTAACSSRRLSSWRRSPRVKVHSNGSAIAS